MGRLYLVRRNLESFLGPMTIEELATSYERMDFGLQDEVGGHCGKWTSFDDLDSLEKNYPELLSMVKEKMLGGWGVSEHTATRIIKTKKDKSVTKRRRRGWLFFVVAVGSIATLLTLFLANHKFASRIFPLSGDSILQHAHQFLSEQRHQEFQQYLEPLIADQLDRIKNSRKTYHDWIPYLRAYAFLDQGRIDDFPPRLLRGINTIYAPQDCSLHFWQQQWRAAERNLIQLTRNDMVQKQPWAQLLTWDPHWIYRRNTDASWIYPQSYYEGCIIMAKKAWGMQHPDHATLNNDTFGVLSRLDYLLSALRGQVVTHDLASNHALGTLTCIDHARSEAELARCPSDAASNQAWQELLERRRRLTQLRLLTEVNARVDSQGLTQIAALSARLPAQDPMNEFDYQAELRFFRAILRSNGNINDAVRQLGTEHQDVNFIATRSQQ